MPPAPQIPTLAPPPPSAPPEAEPGFEAVEVDLGTRRFDRPVPFEIPFYLWGKVPADTRMVGIQIAESPGKSRLEDFEPAWSPDPPLIWHHLPELDQPDDKGRLSFRIMILPLQSRRYYQFRFWITPTLQQSETFRRSALVLLDQALQEVRASVLTNEQTRDLQAKLVRTLQDVTVTGQLLTNATVFDAQNPVGLPELKRATETALTPQANLRDSWSAFLLGQATLSTAAVQIRDDANLAKLVTLTGRSQDLLRDYARLQATYMQTSTPLAPQPPQSELPPDPNAPPAAEPAAPATPAEAAAVQDVNLEELLTNLQEQVQRFSRLTEVLKGYPALLEQTRQTLAALGEVETKFLSGTFDVSSMSDVVALFSNRDPAQLEKLLVSYAAAEAALAKLQAFLTAPDTVSMLQVLVETRELSPGLSDEERQAIQALTAEGGEIFKARETAVSLQEFLRAAQAHGADRTAAIDKLASIVRDAAHEKVLFLASTSGIIETQRRSYISADVGVVYAFSLGKVLPYVGGNLYFRPINKKVPLRQNGAFMRRLAVTLGVTIPGVADEASEDVRQTRENLFAGRALLLGAGLRVTNSLRLGGGGVIFMKKDPNPLVDDSSLAVAPYLSASLDIDVQGLLKKAGEAVGGLFK